MRLAALAILVLLTGCPAYDVYNIIRMREIQREMYEGYQKYCAEHVKECVDAYNNSAHIYVSH